MSEDNTVSIVPEEAPPSWEVKIDGQLTKAFSEQYTKEGTILEDEFDIVIETAAKVLAQLPYPKLTSGRSTGIAIGKVQSGKTLSYTALTAMALDNGFRIVIILAGTKNALLEQTNIRLSNDLKFGKSGTLPIVQQFKNIYRSDSNVIEKVLKSGRNVLVVALKHPDRINKIADILNDPSIRLLPTLIIDDEGDEASLKNRGRNGSRNSVNDSISKLRGVLPIHGYVSYTATPQANLLIDKIDELSPDFAVMVKPGNGYCGGSVFFGDNEENYVKTVEVSEGENGGVTQIQDGLKKALAVFFVGSAIRSKISLGEGTQIPYHSMLIHTSLKQEDHDNLEKALDPFINTWEDILSLKDNDPSRIELMELLRDAHTELSNTVRDIPQFENLFEQLSQAFVNCELWKVNSTGKDPVQLPFRLPNNILIGGNMLGRGVTIPGLAVTYITREAKNDSNADTLEQRARWFGYKEPYLPFCRIYLTSKLKEKYTELLEHEDDLWETLERNEAQGLKVKDWPTMFRLKTKDLKLRPTRSSVANYREFRGTGWDRQNKLLIDPGRAYSNVSAVKKFFNSRNGKLKHFGEVTHLQIEEVDVMDAILGLLYPIDSKDTDWENDYTIEYLTRLNFKGVLSKIEILLMSQDKVGEFSYRVRQYDEAHKITLFQGRSEKRTSNDPSYYPGDANIADGKVQLQVHLITAKDKSLANDVQTVAFALHIPAEEKYDLNIVVKGKDRL